MGSRGTIFDIALDEIALEGLEGITLPSLWIYLNACKDISINLNAETKNAIWAYIKTSKRDLKFYVLPEERPAVKYYKRFSNVDSDLGVWLTPAECPFPRYKYVPIEEENILGSCEFYEERVEISFKDLQDLSLDDVMNTYGDKFVIVGSQNLRYRALTPENMLEPDDLSPLHYCIWEAIGRSRWNGETTAGSWSLLHFSKDSAIIFYIKTKLVKSRLVYAQGFNEKRKNRVMVSTLLTLPRFYSTQKTSLTHVVEKLFFAIKKTPDHRMTMPEVRALFPSIERQKSLKKITTTHFFRRVFDTQLIPVPQSSENSNQKQQESPKERTVSMICLRDSNLEVEKIFAKEFADPNGESSDDEPQFCEETHSVLDMSFREDIYRAIQRHGSRGCSQSEICDYLGQYNVTIRHVIKSLENDGLVKSYCTDVGRQRLKMYVAIENTDKVTSKKDKCLDMLKSLKCADEPNIPNNKDNKVDDIPAISVRINPYEFDKDMLNRETPSTQRTLARKAIIIQIVDEKCIVQTNSIRSKIQKMEAEKGYKDEVCQKSVRRLLSALCASNILRMYIITLQYEEHVRIYRIVTHPKIEIDSEVLQQEIFQLKNSMFLAIEDQRLRLSAHNKIKKSGKKCNKSAEKLKKETLSVPAQKPPKFLVSRYFHEFLFYIVVELNDFQSPRDIDEDLLEQWKITEPALVIQDYMEQLNLDRTKLLAYTSDISWRTFIPPLPKYADKPAGWVYFIDAMERIPLSIFNKIFRIEKTADESIRAYLNHPVRQHYLVRQLPIGLQIHISRIHLQKMYTTVLKLLQHMGLIQVSERLNARDPLVLWVYLNRDAQIMDTTSTEASYTKINPERDYTNIKFNFGSAEDVHQYWMNLQRVCVYTKLGFGRGKQGKLGRSKELLFLESVSFDDAPSYDRGITPGDGLGAAGLSTHLLAHTFRNWSWVLHTNSNPKYIRAKRMAPASKQTRMPQQKKKPALKRLQLGGGTRRTTKKKPADRDAIDKDALKNMRTLRVSWNSKEDNILKIARAVYVYIAAPVSALGLLTVGRICRDVMRHSIGSFNKTAQSCVRRISFLIKNHRHLPEVPTWLHMLQANTAINEKYGDGFLTKLKEVYPNRNDYSNALTIHFITIMHSLYKLINNETSEVGSRFIIPDTIEEFEKRFICRPFVINDNIIEHQNPETDFDTQVVTVKSVLHSSLCSARDKTLYNSQAFEIYKTFSEEVLQAAFTKARSQTLVVALKRKSMHTLPNQLSGPAYLLSSRYRYRLMFLKIPYALYDSCYAFFERALSTFFGASPSSSRSKKPIIELKSPNLGHLVFIAEGLAQNYLETNVKLPTNILTVDAEQQPTVSSMDRILDHYHTIFDNAPQTEYIKEIENEAITNQVRVKFHPANLSYKIRYTPYDVISKLPTRYLHFFCALDHLEKEVDINFSKLQRMDDEKGFAVMECPFNCIMKSANYLNDIERIVQENKSALKEFTDSAPQKLLKQAYGGCVVTVQPSNLLTIVDMLESFWREKENEDNRKDIGKISANVKVNKIEWQKLCNEILEFNTNEEVCDKDDEYEPTLNKEERPTRAQDVFVVNLPTLQIGASPELYESEENILHNGIPVPAMMLETDIQREAILQKVINDSYWKYTENSIESIVPLLKDFTSMELKHLKDIHDFIEKRKLGVSGDELLRQFPYKQFLLRALKSLCEHFLIKRVGVATFLYVHKSHMRSWVVHTFHIKRLESESLGGSSVISQKRERLADDEDDEPDEPAVKVSKVVADDDKEKSLPKRVSTPVQRLIASQQESKPTKTNVKRDVIVMRPQPWMRLNGSLNRRVLDRWLGSVLTECVARCGCSVQDICTRFPHMLPVDIMFLLEILCDMKCVYMKEIKDVVVTLFSEYEDIEETDATEIYNPASTYVTAYADAILRMSIFIGNKKYSSDFI